MDKDLLSTLRFYASRYESLDPQATADLDNASAFWRDFLRTHNLDSKDPAELQKLLAMFSLLFTTGCAVLEDNPNEVITMQEAVDNYMGGIAMIILNMLPQSERTEVLAKRVRFV
jgi:hypothetical protein